MNEEEVNEEEVNEEEVMRRRFYRSRLFWCGVVAAANLLLAGQRPAHPAVVNSACAG